jgi:hypothetical protein
MNRIASFIGDVRAQVGAGIFAAVYFALESARVLLP